MLCVQVFVCCWACQHSVSPVLNHVEPNKATWTSPGTAAPEEWGGEVELALFRSPTLVEAAFLLRGPRALLLADAAFKMDTSCGVPRGEIWQARLTGSRP